MKKNILCIIPARGGSRRIPQKNVKLFFGKPIISYPIKAALAANCFSKVFVSTDDKKIAEVAKKYGAVVPFMRSKKNSGDFATLAQVVQEVICELKKRSEDFDFICCILPTAVFATPSKILEGKMKIEADKKINSVISITRFSYPIQRAFKIENGKIKFLFKTAQGRRSQDFIVAYHDAGQFYWLRSDQFVKNKCKRLTDRRADFVEFLDSQVQDVDTLEDWKIAEIKYHRLSI